MIVIKVRYHELLHVEASFRMTKLDLRARPVFHHEREAIEAHLTVVFAALAVSRYLQNQTGVSIKKIVQTLRGARSATRINVPGISTSPSTPNSPPPPATLLRKLKQGHEGQWHESGLTPAAITVSLDPSDFERPPPCGTPDNRRQLDSATAFSRVGLTHATVVKLFGLR